jgi:hypothetical protein
VQPQKAPLNIRVPPELREQVKANARRKGLTVDAYCTRILTAAVQSEDPARPGFLEAWEKFLREQKQTP